MQILADRDIGYIADCNRGTATARDHNSANVIEAGHLPGRPNQVLRTEALDIARSDIGIVSRQRLHQIL
jgi:hypothetical protein